MFLDWFLTPKSLTPRIFVVILLNNAVFDIVGQMIFPYKRDLQTKASSHGILNY